MADLKFGTVVIPGLVLQGFNPEDPQLAMSAFHPPGTSANVIITLGLMPRRIVVPMLLVSSNFSSYERVHDFLAELEEVKSRGREEDLKVPITTPGRETTLTFERCYFDGFKKNPKPGILQDVGALSGSLANKWFVEGVAVFVQAVVLKKKSGL